MHKPNILLIMTDQQSAQMMSCAGNSFLSTPALDSLAARGTRFELAFSANPVCVPARFSLFTGRYPSAIGQRSNVFSGIVPESIKETGMGNTIAAAGYDVAYAGKQHLPGMDATELGFDYICSDERDALADACAAYIQRPHDQPFFLVCSFINPHDICYMALRENASTPNEAGILQRGEVELQTLNWALQKADVIPTAEFWNTKCPPLPANHAVQQDEPEAITRILLDQRPFRKTAREEWDEGNWRLHRWAYHRLTEKVDGQIQTVLEALQSAQLVDETVVIFTSDHGDHDAAHKLEHKTALYEEATRVPLIIAEPDAAAALDRQHLCSGVDLFPTLCDYAGVPAPDDLSGSSLRPLLHGEPEWRDHVLIESECGYGLRTVSEFYALYDEGANREQLYDLRKDPGQTRNFAHCPMYASRLGQLRRLLQEKLV